MRLPVSEVAAGQKPELELLVQILEQQLQLFESSWYIPFHS